MLQLVYELCSFCTEVYSFVINTPQNRANVTNYSDPCGLDLLSWTGYKLVETLMQKAQIKPSSLPWTGPATLCHIF